MTAFDPNAYGPVLAALLCEPRLQPLGPGQPNEACRSQLRSLSCQTAFAHTTVVDADLASCCLAGLWLYHDFLEESHRISQGIATTSGSYWHGLMHRREGDFSNASYWFRRVGRHPVFQPLQVRAAQLAAEVPSPAAAFLRKQAAWDPFAFLDFCERTVRGQTQDDMLCRQIQQVEWELLFDFCYRHAVAE